jgi:TP901 family phage tail tape measure protein
MSDTRELKVVIKGDTSGFSNAMKEVSTNTEKSGTSLTKLSSAVALGQAGLQVIEGITQKLIGSFSSFATVTEELGSQTLKLQRSFGLTSEQASGMIAVFERFGLSADDASKSLGIFQKNMIDVRDSASGGKKVFSDLGIQVQDSNGHLRNMSDVLLDVADKFKNDIPVTERAARAKDLFGKSGQALIPVLLQGKQGIIELEKHAQSMGLVLSQNNVEAIRKHMVAQKNLKEAVKGLQVQIGLGLMPILAAFGTSVSDLVAHHGRAIISIGLAAGAVGIFGAAILGVAKAMQVFQITSFLAFVTNPAILALIAIAVLMGVVVYKAMNNLQQKMQQTTNTSKNLTDALGSGVPAGANKATAATNKLGEQLAKLDEQISQANQNFQESMATMIKSHQTKVVDLKGQLNQENSDFKDAQEQQVYAHQKKVGDLTMQINHLAQQGAQADQEKLASLRDELAHENSEYDKQTAKDKIAHDKKMADIQAQLDEETALLKKHADDVSSVKDVQLADEIDKLKQNHQQQLQAFDEQKRSLIENANQTTAGIEGEFSKLPGDIQSQLSGGMSNTGDTLGQAMGVAFKDALKSTVKDLGKIILDGVKKVGAFAGTIASMASGAGIADLIKNKGNFGKTIDDMWTMSANAFGVSARASGGPVSSNSPYVVGEQGPELFVPDQGGSIVPNHALGGSPNITVNVGMYAGMPVEKRQIAVELYQELTRAARAQGVQLQQIGVGSLQ